MIHFNTLPKNEKDYILQEISNQSKLALKSKINAVDWQIAIKNEF
jgi:hypothetical protein